jgi:hypothetical protein
LPAAFTPAGAVSIPTATSPAAQQAATSRAQQAGPIATATRAGPRRKRPDPGNADVVAQQAMALEKGLHLDGVEQPPRPEGGQDAGTRPAPGKPLEPATVPAPRGA